MKKKIRTYINTHTEICEKPEKIIIFTNKNKVKEKLNRTIPKLTT